MARVTHNPNFERDFLRSSSGRTGLFMASAMTIARAVETKARQAEGDFDDLARRFGPVEVEATDKGARVFTTSPWAPIVEWGTARNAPAAPMRTGAKAAGFKVIEEPR